jgi:DNA mismatch repair protein MSH5
MYNYTKPEITDTDCLLLEKMRHPILEHLEDRFVMNDIGLGFYEDQILPKALLITGPNASGKSVYLHQVALIVYMAHLGCFVPCEFAVIGLTDKILTRIRTKTSVSLRESTFQSDLNQACMSIVQSTPKSLVLLDEFGKGK